MNSREWLRKRLDEVKVKHGVSVYFPRNLVRGDYQDMVMKGGVSTVFAAKQDIERLLMEWRVEYDDFKARKANRERQDRRVVTEMPVSMATMEWPSLYGEKTVVSTVTKGATKNPYSALSKDDEQVTAMAMAPKETKAKKASGLTGWNKVAGPEASETPMAYAKCSVMPDAPKRVSSGGYIGSPIKFAWGDMV